MASQDETSPERATTAIVSAKLDTVLATMAGNHGETKANLADVQRQLDAVTFLPGVVSGLTSEVRQLDRRVTLLEPLPVALAEVRTRTGTLLTEMSDEMNQRFASVEKSTDTSRADLRAERAHRIALAALGLSAFLGMAGLLVQFLR